MQTETKLIIGRRYTMPDGTAGKYIGIHHGEHVDYRCFRLAGAKVSFVKLTETQARAIAEVNS